MKETMGFILSTWTQYWGEGYYQYLLFIAAIYLLIWKRKKEAARNLLAFLGMFLFLFFCPFTAAVIWKCIGESVYWRILWALPVIPLIACAGTELIRNRRNPALRVILLGAAAACIVFSGKSVWQAGNYERVHNYQKVPDEVAQICSLLQEDSKGEEIKVATVDYLASYIRVYDPSIRMPYGRAGRSAVNKRIRRLYRAIHNPDPDYQVIGTLARRCACNYLVVKLHKEDGEDILEEKGFHRIGNVNDYVIFARNSTKNK